MARAFDMARMTAAELRDALSDLDISRRNLAFVLNVGPKRVNAWWDGTEDIPHHVRILLETWQANPPSYNLAFDRSRELATVPYEEQEG